MELPEGRRVIGKVWPKDVAVLARCKKRVYDMHYKQVRIMGKYISVAECEESEDDGRVRRKEGV